MKIKRSTSNPDLRVYPRTRARRSKRSISNPSLPPEQEHEDIGYDFKSRCKTSSLPLNKSTKIFAKRSISNPISEVTPEQEHEDLG